MIAAPVMDVPVMDEAQLRRRARVIAWRLAHGELVHADFSDPAWPYVHEGYRVAPGAALGSLP